MALSRKLVMNPNLICSDMSCHDVISLPPPHNLFACIMQPFPLLSSALVAYKLPGRGIFIQMLIYW